MKNLSLEWTKNLKGKEKEDTEATIRNSRVVLGRLKEIIEERNTALQKNEVSPSSFDSPNWALNQAYINGQRYALQDLLKLLSFLET